MKPEVREAVRARFFPNLEKEAADRKEAVRNLLFKEAAEEEAWGEEEISKEASLPEELALPIALCLLRKQAAPGDVVTEDPKAKGDKWVGKTKGAAAAKGKNWKVTPKAKQQAAAAAKTKQYKTNPKVTAAAKMPIKMNLGNKPYSALSNVAGLDALWSKINKALYPKAQPTIKQKTKQQKTLSTFGS